MGIEEFFSTNGAGTLDIYMAKKQKTKKRKNKGGTLSHNIYKNLPRMYLRFHIGKLLKIIDVNICKQIKHSIPRNNIKGPKEKEIYQIEKSVL